MNKFVALLVIGLLLVSACATPQKSQTDPLVEKLQQGGYVIFFRHAATDHSQKDIDKKNLGNCDTQRRLDEKGRQQSNDIGDGFKMLEIPVGEVVTSQYCRCINTAMIAFGKATPSVEITSIQDVTLEVKQQRIAKLRKMLATPPRPGTNTVLVAHKGMFKDASGHLLEEGEAAIFQPQAHDTAHFVRRVKADEWKTLNGD